MKPLAQHALQSDLTLARPCCRKPRAGLKGGPSPTSGRYRVIA